MPTVAQVKKTILQAAGNPESGVIFRMAQTMAEAVVALYDEKPTREKRVLSATETR